MADLANLTTSEKLIRRQIQTSNRAIQLLKETSTISNLSPSQAEDVKVLVEACFRYKHFDKLTLDEKAEREALELEYKQRFMQKINLLLQQRDNPQRKRKLNRRMKSLVGGEELQRWEHATPEDMKSVRYIQQFFR